MSHDRVHPNPIPAGQRKQIDQLVAEFGQEFREGHHPQIEVYLERFPELRSYLLEELIALEVALRRSAGQQPQADDYHKWFPDDHDAIEAVFLSEAATSRTVDRRTTPDDTDTEDEPTAERLGRYQIRRRLGRGAFGVVYLAHDPQLDRPVALKVPRRQRLRTPEQIAKFVQEARTAARLKHPAIVTVHDVQEQEGWPYIVQEFIEGQDLAEWAARQRPSCQDVARLLAGVADAVGYAHQHGLIHCDLKLANVLMDTTGKPHVADFGLAIHESVQALHKGEVFGTPAVMAPEQVRGESHRLDGRTDIWAIGVMLYELLVGRKPFRAERRDELFEEIQRHDPKPPRQIDRGVPRELERVCLKALSKRATDRYTTAEDMADDLRKFLGNTESSDVPASDRGTKLRTAFKVHTSLLGCTLKASLVIGVCTLICIYLPHHLWVRSTRLAPPLGRGPAFPEKNEVLDLTCLLLIGLAAGWLAGKLGKGHNVSLLGTLMVGVIGAVLGGFLFRIVDFAAIGLLGNLISAAVGAFVLLFVLQKIKG